MTYKRLLKRGLIETAICQSGVDIDMKEMKKLVDNLEQMPPSLILENAIAFEKWFDLYRRKDIH